MTSFPGHQDLPEKPFTEQLDQFNPSFSPRHNYFTLSPPSFFVPEGLQDLLNQLLPISTTPPQSPLMPATQIPCVPLDTNIKANRNTKALQGLDISGHKRAVKKDRHSKIYTATGPRDRRMRLSLEVARKFFNLQDMLGFDKASKTVQWLLNVSDEAIKELAGVLQPKSFSRNSSCSTESYPSESEGASTVSDLKAKSSMLGITNVPETCKIKNTRTAIRTHRKAISNPMLQKETRAKARARARERTRDKKMMFSTSTPLASFDLTEASSSSHNDLYMKLANERVYGFEMGADGSELLTPIFDYGSYQNATSVNQAVNVLQEQWGLERLPLCQCTNQLQTLRGFQALTASHNCNY